MKINIRVRDSGENKLVKTIDTEECILPGTDMASEIFKLLHEGHTVIIEEACI